MNYDRELTAELGRKIFSYRDYTPIPIILLLFFIRDSSVLSAGIVAFLFFLVN